MPPPCTPGHIKPFRLMDNRSHQESGWDIELLEPEIAELQALNIDTALTGFDAEEISKFLDSGASDGSRRSRSPLGQSYRVGGHRGARGCSGAGRGAIDPRVMNLKRRLKVFEKGLISEPITLVMPNGNTVTLRGGGDYALDLVARACRGDRTPEIELVAHSISSTEPGGGHLVDLARAILNSQIGRRPVKTRTAADQPANSFR